MKNLIVSLLFLSTALISISQTVDTISIHSKSMNKDIEHVIVLPDGYDKSKDYPVVYLLHGYGGNHKSWIQVYPELPELASFYDFIVVCPNGSNSWYLDAPADSTSRYETFISSELIEYIDSAYSTIALPQGRAITGLSMGGHGAMYNAIKHQDVFGACGATSGGVDITPFPGNWGLKNLLGDYSTNKDIWEENSVIFLINKIQPTLAIAFDCGDSDFFHNVNEKLHSEMQYHNIKHEYTVRPGAHNGDYWNRSIPHHLEFFHQYFLKNATPNQN